MMQNKTAAGRSGTATRVGPGWNGYLLRRLVVLSFLAALAACKKGSGYVVGDQPFWTGTVQVLTPKVVAKANGQQVYVHYMS